MQGRKGPESSLSISSHGLSALVWPLMETTPRAGGDFQTRGGAGRMALTLAFLVVPFGLHSSTRGRRERGSMTSPGKPLEPAMGFCRMTPAVDKPSPAEQHKVGKAIRGAAPLPLPPGSYRNLELPHWHSQEVGLCVLLLDIYVLFLCSSRGKHLSLGSLPKGRCSPPPCPCPVGPSGEKQQAFTQQIFLWTYYVPGTALSELITPSLSSSLRSFIQPSLHQSIHPSYGE